VPSLSVEERAFLAAHGPIRFAPDPTFPPFEFIDGSGRAAGITPDLLDVISRNLGISITTRRFGSWGEVMDAVRSGEADVLGTLTRTPEREQFLLFTRPYLTVPTVLFVRRDERAVRMLADLRNRRVGVVRDYGAHSWLQRNRPELEPVLVNAPMEGLTELAAGRLEAFIEAMPVGLYLIRERSLVTLRMLPDAVFTSPQHLAVRSDLPLLRSILQKGLDGITERERAAIFVRWTGVDLAGRPRWLSPVVWNVLGVLAVLALGALAWVVSLRRMLARRTLALAAREASYRRLFERNLAGVYRSTLDGRLLDCNEAFARLYGYGSRAEVLEHSALDLYRDTDGRREFLEALRGQGSVIGFESRGRRKDGRELWLLESASLAHDESGRATEIEGTLIDITERRTVEEQLRQSQKMEAIGMLAGGVAHDFNNLLQAMLATVTLAQAEAGDEERLTGRLREIEGQVRKGAALTRQLLLFSRRDTARPETLDLNDVVRTATDLLRRMVRENIVFALRLDPGPLPVLADRGQLEQVLVNLVVNAGDAMPEGGRVEVATWQRGSQVGLTVSDSGPGVDATIQERIFDPFFTTKAPGEGTGLGLSVVHGIVTRSGGSVGVAGHDGGGATFTVALPRDEAPPGAAPTAAPAGDARSGGGERVLVVEDEADARSSLAEILTSLGYEVTAVGSGEEAVALPAAEPFDVLLTDLVLPGRSGGDTALELCLRWPALRVIYMSGYTQDEALRIAAVGGFVRYLQKPFDVGTLARELGSALQPVW